MSINLGRIYRHAVALILTLGLVVPAAAANARAQIPPPAGIHLAASGKGNALTLLSKHGLPPNFLRQVVPYQTKQKIGTIVVATNERYLYLVLPRGKALRYGIGVARSGFEWSGIHAITAKRQWPSWTPPAEMLKRRPDIPKFMEGGPNNPMGARALYIGSTLYRIHGTTEPWSIGGNVSSGCIRLTNEDVIDLFARVQIGAKVVVF